MLTLYVIQDCLFCRRVMNKINELGLVGNKDYQKIDASYGSEARDFVISKGGASQVPFMIDGDVQMYESEAIKNYITQKFSSPE